MAIKRSISRCKIITNEGMKRKSKETSFSISNKEYNKKCSLADLYRVYKMSEFFRVSG